MDYVDYIDYLLDAPIERVVRDRRDPFDIYSNIEFRERFGFSKDSFLSLLDLIGPYLEHDTDRNFALSPQLQLLCSLRIFRTGSYQLVAGDLINVHRTTAGRALNNVINGLLTLKPLYITMPSTQEQCGEKSEPFIDERLFSINAQFICDADMKIKNVVSRWPGSTHDARI
ncbi:uncharacterized protein LOC124355625 [Homalodisca vitripennis]|uniref:uncharacterized protein LOC124355625 n=1 Tax=Homalodisca vitripennis TaxID=197043 RepID=UPI001EEC65C7|nr:uncharacterized protein LOC124355625 [Homalodisca vitripennis]